jgi:hypothetical protein
MRTRSPAAAVCVALGLALAGCGSSGHPAASAATQIQDPSGRAQLEAVVQCLRAHGVPDFPDPVYDTSDGRWHYGDYRQDIPQSAQQACRHLDPSAVRPSPPVPQAQFQELLKLARCVRQHGMANWPDPTPQGQFQLTPQLSPKLPAVRNAVDACRKYLPSTGLNVGSAP